MGWVVLGTSCSLNESQTFTLREGTWDLGTRTWSRPRVRRAYESRSPQWLKWWVEISRGNCRFPFPSSVFASGPTDPLPSRRRAGGPLHPFPSSGSFPSSSRCLKVSACLFAPDTGFRTLGRDRPYSRPQPVLNPH